MTYLLIATLLSLAGALLDRIRLGSKLKDAEIRVAHLSHELEATRRRELSAVDKAKRSDEVIRLLRKDLDRHVEMLKRLDPSAAGDLFIDQLQDPAT